MTRQKPILECVGPVGGQMGMGIRSFAKARCDITLGRHRKVGLLFLAVRNEDKAQKCDQCWARYDSASHKWVDVQVPYATKRT